MNAQPQHDHDQRPGWTYLNGQHKPMLLQQALTERDQAWKEYERAIDDSVPAWLLHNLLDNATRWERVVQLQYKLWSDYLADNR